MKPEWLIRKAENSRSLPGRMTRVDRPAEGFVPKHEREPEPDRLALRTFSFQEAKRG